MLDRIFKRVVPVAAMAVGLALSGCDMDISINGDEGVPLAELDMSGDPPSEVALLGPDTIVITEGSALDIEVEGDDKAVAAMRFTLDGDTLGVMRDSDEWDKGKAIVRVTMPAPESLNMAGSGRIEAATMADRPDINIAGSGSVEVESIQADKFEVNMAGSGSITAGGTAKSLEVAVMGSGTTDLSNLKADDAEVSIAGSGDVSFASDGAVEANIAGSGDVTVSGRATCEVNSVGSGSLTCRAGEDTDQEEASSEEEADSSDEDGTEESE